MKSAIANTWLRLAPDAPPERQVLFGDHFEVTHTDGEFSVGKALKDDSAGCVLTRDLGAATKPTYWVSVRTTWAYARPDIRSEPLMDLHLTSRVETISGASDGWTEIRCGEESAFIASTHLRSLGDFIERPVNAARLFLGAPYVWAGNTGFGLDCSGLVQAALRACGVTCLADSHQQEAMKGTKLDGRAPLQAGDLLFWRGHVAMATGPDSMIHANAHHMMVVEEPTDQAIARIANTDTGPITTRLRPDLTIEKG